MSAISPREVLDLVARAVPVAQRAHLVVIGSLAAGYQLLEQGALPVSTKDIDCVLSPRVTAATNARVIAQALLDAGWKPRQVGPHAEPGSPATPDDRLPVIRLHPPASTSWFIELLVLPDSRRTEERQWTRVRLAGGHFGLPSFRFLPITTFRPHLTESGLQCARVEMMVLGNLLEHPRIRPELISGSTTKRSNKDLGRVLAIVRLSEDLAMASWPRAWREGLTECFPEEWQDLALKAGTGLRELLASTEDFHQAYASCMSGLLASRFVTQDQLRFTGLRFVQDVIEPLEVSAHGAPS